MHRVPVIEHVPPDLTACRHWLANRNPSSWKLQPESRVKLPVQTDGSAKSLTAVLVETLNAVTSGRISFLEAGRIADLVQTTGNSLDRLEIEKRLAAVEQPDPPKMLTHDGKE